MKAKVKKRATAVRRKHLIKKVRKAAPNGASATGFRGVEDEWLAKHPEKLRAVAGEYVVVQGRRIVAHSKDAALALQNARKRGVKIPYIFSWNRRSLRTHTE